MKNDRQRYFLGCAAGVGPEPGAVVDSNQGGAIMSNVGLVNAGPWAGRFEQFWQAEEWALEGGIRIFKEIR